MYVLSFGDRQDPSRSVPSRGGPLTVDSFSNSYYPGRTEFLSPVPERTFVSEGLTGHRVPGDT